MHLSYTDYSSRCLPLTHWIRDTISCVVQIQQIQREAPVSDLSGAASWRELMSVRSRRKGCSQGSSCLAVSGVYTMSWLCWNVIVPWWLRPEAKVSEPSISCSACPLNAAAGHLWLAGHDTETKVLVISPSLQQTI